MILNLSSISILLLSLNFLLCSNETIITINALDPTIVPFLNTRINTTSRGTFKIVYPGSVGEENKNHQRTFPTAWMQDDGNNRLYISTGNVTQGICIREYWFVKGKHYIREFPTFNCSEPAYECVTGYGYEEEVTRYNSTYIGGYMGRAFVYRFQREVDIYSGRVLDAVGPLTCMMYIGTNDSSYVALSILNDNQVTGNSSIAYFKEYFYDEIKMGQVPDANFFDIPQQLLDFETAHNCSIYPYDMNNGNSIENKTNDINRTNNLSIANRKNSTDQINFNQE